MIARPEKIQQHRALRQSTLTAHLIAASDCHDFRKSPVVALSDTFESQMSGGLLSYGRTDRLSAFAVQQT